MTTDSAEGTPFAGLREAGAREDDVLCLLLLYHRHILEERSPLKKHIDALPREYHQTIFYSGKLLCFFFVFSGCERRIGVFAFIQLFINSFIVVLWSAHFM